MNNNNKRGILMSPAAWSVIVASGVTLLFYLVPFLYPLSYPFLLISTLVHELGHGLAALVVGGSFQSFKMWSNGSGVATISGNFGNLSQAFVAASGLLGPPICACLFFIGAKTQSWARIMLGCFAVFLIIICLLYVRNFFGVFFVLFLSLICCYFSMGYGKNYAQIMLAFFGAQLSLSVFSRSDYLFTQYAQTSMGAMPSDVAQISQALFLPYWFWGALIGLFSLLVLVLGFRIILK